MAASMTHHKGDVEFGKVLAHRADASKRHTELFGTASAKALGGKLSVDGTNEIIQGTVEPNNILIYIALAILIFNVPWYSSWTAKIGIVPG